MGYSLSWCQSMCILLRSIYNVYTAAWQWTHLTDASQSASCPCFVITTFPSDFKGMHDLRYFDTVWYELQSECSRKHMLRRLFIVYSPIETPAFMASQAAICRSFTGNWRHCCLLHYRSCDLRWSHMLLTTYLLCVIMYTHIYIYIMYMYVKNFY